MVKGELPAIQTKLEEEISAIQIKPEEEPCIQIKLEEESCAQNILAEELSIQTKLEESLAIQIKLEEEPAVQIKLEEETFAQNILEGELPAIQTKLEEEISAIQIKLEEEPCIQIKLEEGSAQNTLAEQPSIQIKLEEEPLAIQIKLEEELSIQMKPEELVTQIQLEEETCAQNVLEYESSVQNIIEERLLAIQTKVEVEPLAIQIMLEQESSVEDLQSSGRRKAGGILCRMKRSADESALPSAPKRKRVVMSLRDKVRVLDLLRSGKSVASVGRQFSINESTVRSIRQKEDDIRKCVRESAPESAKVTSVVRDKAIEKMEKRLSIWINETVGRKGSVVDTASIRLKAKQIYEHVTENQESVKPFSASAGWLARFKNRYGFKNVKLSGEAGSADVEAAKEFVRLLLKIIKEKGYQPEQVFNTDETSLFYKQTGSRTYISKNVAKAPGFKAFNDRATLLFCANARGDFKCKPLMVYRAQNPRALKGKNLAHLPVIWKWNRKAWMTAKIFGDWFNNHFIPAVEQYLAKKNLAFRVLLILDNAPAHVRQDLENAHPHVEVLFMPPNTSSVLQPLEQGIIKVFKSHYTQELYCKACQHLEANPDSTMMDFWKSITIRDVIDYVEVAWEKISQATINNCWKKAWPQCVTNFKDFQGVDVQIKNNVQTIMCLARRIGGDGFDEMQEEDVAEILTQPAIELTNEELDAMAKEGRKDSDDDDDDDDDDDNDNDKEGAQKIVPLSIAKLEKWASLFDQVSKDIQESDPSVERSLKFKRQLEGAFHPYAKLLKELRWKSRQTLTQFFAPVGRKKYPQPSTSRGIASAEEKASDVGDVELPSLLPSP